MSDSEPMPEPQGNPLADVKNIIAVGAGKGGVGKSTVAALIALGLKRKGMKTGLLDADVYGPSMPMITGTVGGQPYAGEDGFIVPPERDGIRVMSMGFLVPDSEAVIWRGPMAQKYVAEFLTRCVWGKLDCLIVDLPPGTGDIPLTLSQTIPLTGAVVVCTPQDLALLDTVKALKMYEKLGVETLGVVENMSYHICPQCGHREDTFGHGGAEQAADKLKAPFLGGIPLNIAIRRNGDAGALAENFTQTEPYVVEAIEQVVNRLVEQIELKRRKGVALPQLKVSG
jgi:ATP-binding protein involved in chromosome partitioning